MGSGSVKTKETLPDVSGPEDLFPEESGELVTYFSPRKEYKLTLRSIRRQSVNGFVETIPGYTVDFRNHYYKTRNPVIISAIDKLLSGHRKRHFAKRVHKVPSQTQMDAYDKKARAKKRAMDELEKKFAQETEVENFKAIEKKVIKEKPKYVKGVARSV